jgi:hypothetical protein
VAPVIPAQPGPRPLPTRSRRPGLIAVAVLLIVGFGLSGAVLVSRAGHTTEVLVAARPVAAGHVIAAGDVGVARMSGTVRAIASGDVGTVVGRTVTVGVVAGQVFNRDMLTGAAVPGKDQAVIGLSLAPGRFPADGLAVGDRVLAVVIPSATDPAAVSGPPAARAITTALVYGMRPDPTRGPDTLVSLVVPLDQANQVLANSAVGRIGLVKVAAP